VPALRGARFDLRQKLIVEEDRAGAKPAQVKGEYLRGITHAGTRPMKHCSADCDSTEAGSRINYMSRGRARGKLVSEQRRRIATQPTSFQS
jgi:hypothetical protein